MMTIQIVKLVSFLERRRSVSPHPFAQMEEEIEEFWNPKNVVFLEDSQNIPIGTVLKVCNTFSNLFVERSKFLFDFVAFSLVFP